MYTNTKRIGRTVKQRFIKEDEKLEWFVLKVLKGLKTKELAWSCGRAKVNWVVFENTV